MGTAKENTADSVMKARNARGERNGHSKLTEPDVREIKSLYKSGFFTHKMLSRKFHICGEVVNGILNGYYWKHVS